jgi:hypothetical protein
LRLHGFKLASDAVFESSESVCMKERSLESELCDAGGRERVFGRFPNRKWDKQISAAKLSNLAAVTRDF